MATPARQFALTAAESLAANEVLLVFHTSDPIPARDVLSLINAIEDGFRERGFLRGNGFIDVVAIEQGSWRWRIRFNGLHARKIYEAWKEIGAALALPASIVALFTAVPGESDESDGPVPTTVVVSAPETLGVAATVESRDHTAVLWNRSASFDVREEQRVGYFVAERGSGRLNFIDLKTGLILVVGTSKGTEPPLNRPLVAQLRLFGDTAVAQLLAFEAPDIGQD